MDSVYLDQPARSVQSDFGFTLSHKEIFFLQKLHAKGQHLGLYYNLESFISSINENNGKCSKCALTLIAASMEGH